MNPQLTYQEISTILAGLRLVQKRIEAGESFEDIPHFDDVEPPTVEELDEMCSRVVMELEFEELEFAEESRS